MTKPSFQTGIKTIGDYAAKLPDTPGVYRMMDDDGGVLYVGKARCLKKRVVSYANIDKMPERLRRMVSLTRQMEFVHTHTETEALLLESNLIKKLKPRFNILMRDDKSFPYILIAEGHDFPLVQKYRGARKKKGQYFGPFASAGDVNRTISVLQRVFLLRNCPDTVFSNRSCPCLQYHIKRCTAPCVDLVSKDEYAEQVLSAVDFLEGKSRDVQDRMVTQMKQASASMQFEQAAVLRDRVKALASIQARQDINIEGLGSVDVMGFVQKDGMSCIQVFFFRGGRNYGNRAYFPKHDADATASEIMQAFIGQFYENKPVPKEVVVSHIFEDIDLLEAALQSLSNKGERVRIVKPVRGRRNKALAFALKNANASLELRRAQNMNEIKMLEEIAMLFGMDDMPRRIEVYDNSHTSGEDMVGAMIVSGVDGFRKGAYRKFNIKTAAEADDYGMMREVLERRFKRALKENPNMEGEEWPDLIIVDGGKGQLSSAYQVFEELGIADSITLVAIAKGEDRDAGREQFFMVGRAGFQLPMHTPVLHYLQRLRDEAHRFAIGSHRVRRSKKVTASPLDEIPGVGGKRKQALLHYFGSGKTVSNASVEDLARVEGISGMMAQKIYDYFH